MPTLRKNSLLDGFDIPDLSTEKLVSFLKKNGTSHNAKASSDFKNMPIEHRIAMVTETVNSVLGRYKGFVRVIRDETELESYIDKAIGIDYLSFDTETNNSLDPLTCKLMGLCLYVPNSRPVYVPINHTKPMTDELLPNQVSMGFVTKLMQKLADKHPKMVYHNGKFDIRVIHGTTGVYLPIWWDTMIASQLLNENVPAKLKHQYKLHIDPTMDTYNIESMFNGLPYAWIDPDIFALYAAIDAYDTSRLQQYQQRIFEQEDMGRLYKLFREVEVPVVLVTSHMEDGGINMDLDFLAKLNAKYLRNKERCLTTLEKLIAPYANQIRKHQMKGDIDNPINFDSNDQLKVILYDIMKVPVIDEYGKSTEKDALKAIDNEFSRAILDYRHYSKLISSFTEPLPKWLSERDGKLHASFNQMGTEDKGVRTGRFSSTNPNLQQIPSKEKTMRLAFKADTSYRNVTSDSNTVTLMPYEDVETKDGWKRVRDLQVGDNVWLNDDGIDKSLSVAAISFQNDYVHVSFT